MKNIDSFFYKLTFIQGLKDVVEGEIKKHKNLHIVEIKEDSMYLDFVSDFKILKELRSVLNAYVVKRSDTLHPLYISNHKSVLDDLIEKVVHGNEKMFRTFKLSCAGSDSKEVSDIKKFITTTYKVTVAEDADLEIYIGKIGDLWEIGVRLTARPLSLREYKVANIKGGLNPTIAYAMNTFCDLDKATSYLNIFSGSGTLLIEAGLSNSNIKLLGFDSNGKTNALAVENIKKAGLIKSIQLKTANIFDKPALGTVDVITSDLPFGMQISKGEDLGKLYGSFLEYCGETLDTKGVLVMYTTEHELLSKLLESSKFMTDKVLDLKVSTSEGGYIYPKIFVCKFI
jgi:tRNA G10  N-methylase Trm11